MDSVDAGAGGRLHPVPSNSSHFLTPAKGSVLTKDEFESHLYKMDSGQRGVAVIINNYQFDKPLNLQDVPADTYIKTENLLKSMGFDVRTHHNCSIKLMKNIMDDVALIDHKTNDCFVCVILSYGDEGFFYGTDGTINVEDFIKPIKGGKCPSLALKPKIFWIQASKFEEEMFEADSGKESADELNARRIPNEADILMMYSVLPVRERQWFFDAIDTEFTKTYDDFPAWKRLDLLSLMTRVNRFLSDKLEGNNSQWFQKKQQLPCITSTLTKEVLFC